MSRGVLLEFVGMLIALTIFLLFIVVQETNLVVAFLILGNLSLLVALVIKFGIPNKKDE